MSMFLVLYMVYLFRKTVFNLINQSSFIIILFIKSAILLSIIASLYTYFISPLPTAILLSIIASLYAYFISPLPTKSRGDYSMSVSPSVSLSVSPSSLCVRPSVHQSLLLYGLAGTPCQWPCVLNSSHTMRRISLIFGRGMHYGM